MQKTLIVWWRYGKEHGAEDFRVNPPEVIAEHIASKAAAFKAEAGADWPWWQVDDEVLIERPLPGRFSPDTRIYYLLQRGLVVIENIHFKPPDAHWKWYVHLADTTFDPAHDCWVMQDLFCDVLIDPDNQTCRLIDLVDLAEAVQVGLIDKPKTVEILRRTDQLLAAVARDSFLTPDTFPFPEIARAQAAWADLK